MEETERGRRGRRTDGMYGNGWESWQGLGWAGGGGKSSANSKLLDIVAADVSRRTYSVVGRLAPTDVGGYAA